MKKSKQNYFTKYFQSNIKNLKNTWKQIKRIKSSKNYVSSSTILLNLNNKSTSDPLKTAVFNNYFGSIREKNQSKIRFSNKKFTDYFHGKKVTSFLITATDIEEFITIISLLSDNKSSGPNSIPIRILTLLKKDVSTHLVDIFNLTFSLGKYPPL